jgi:hypothetical protein
MKKSLKIQKYIFLALLANPSSIFAFSLTQAGINFSSVISYLLELINLLIPLLVGVAFIIFFWGLSKFILNSNKPEEIKNGRNKMFWGILMLFVLISFKAIIGLVSNELEIGGKTPVVPTLPTNVSAQ